MREFPALFLLFAMSAGEDVASVLGSLTQSRRSITTASQFCVAHPDDWRSTVFNEVLPRMIEAS